MRILHTNMLRGWGGQSNRILIESLAVSRAGEREVALAVPRGSELARRARAAGLRVFDDFTFRGPGKPLSFARDAARLRALLLAEPWDLLHLHGSPDTWAAAVALRGVAAERRPVVIRSRHNVFPIARHPLNAWLYGRNVDALIVISRAVEEQCRALPFLREKPCALIWDAPDLSRFQPPARRETRERLRRELGEPEKAPVVLCCGRLRPEKGQDVLLRAAAELRRRVENARIWLAGDGSHRARWERLAARLGVEDCVRFLGFRTDAPDLMAAADLLCAPSRSEGLGTVALEAHACELPVVASRSGGLPDSVIEGRTGWLVEPEDPRALARALEAALRDPEERRRRAREGRRLILEEFTEARLAERTLAFYQLLAGGSSQTG